MTSGTSKKAFLEQNLTSYFSRPKNKIKPLITNSPLHQDLDEEKLRKKLALHSTTEKDFTFGPQKPPASIKSSVKLLRNQRHLSKLHYRESNRLHFNNNFFFSKLKHLPTLSSLKLDLS